MASVTLNGNTYTLAVGDDGKPLISQGYVSRLSIAYRTTGVQERSDDPSRNRYSQRGFPLGFGANRIHRESGDGLRQFRDATCLTDYPSGVYLPLLAQNSTDDATSVVRASTTFSGNLWTLQETFDTPNYIVRSRKYVGTTTTWTAGGNVISNATVKIGLDIMSYKTGMIALVASGSNHLTYTSTDGVTWTVTGTDITAGLLSNAVTTNENTDFGLLTFIGNEKVAVIWNEAAGTINFFSGTTLTGAWTDESIDIASSNGPQGVAVYPGLDGLSKLYVFTRDGLYEVDTAPATWTITKTELNVASHNDNGRRMTVHQGALWFGLGVDDNTPAPIGRMTVQDRTRTFELKLGLDQATGLPAEMMGPVRWMKTINGRLFVSIGGGAALRFARVLVHNGDGWHSRYRHGTAGDGSGNNRIQWIDVSADDDGTPRLHFAIRTATTTSDTQYLAQPLVDPAAGVTMAYATTSYLRLPEDDLGDPQTDATMYQAAVQADDLTAGVTTADEYIQERYGLDGAADTTATLGNYVSGTKARAFGASSQGVAGRTIARRFDFYRNTAGTPDTSKTPKLRETEIQVEKRVLGPRYWDIVIDVEQTVIDTPPTPVANTPLQETIITNLETVVELTTMPLFAVGQMSAVNVKVPSTVPPNWPLSIGKGGARGNLGFRTGFVSLHLEESA